MRVLSNKYYPGLVTLLLLYFVPAAIFAQDNFREENGTVENQSDITPGENIDEKIKKNFFLKAEVTKTDCFVGEPIMATFKAYSRLDANSQVVKRPSLSGFSVLEMVDAYNTLPDTEKYNGTYYNVHLIRKVELFPLQAGSFTLEAAEVESVIHLYKTEKNERRSIRDLFRRQFRNGSLIQKQVTLETPPVTINVKQLPEKGQPDDFSGAVGNFSVKLEMSDTSLNQYEPAIIKLLVSGTGNLPLITDPGIAWPNGIEVADPQVMEDVNKYQHPLSGTKTFEYTIPTRDTGSFRIPAVQFSYFDPLEKKYKISETTPIAYTVTPSANKTHDNEKIEAGKKESFPLHYLYFGIIAAVIVGAIIFQAVRARKN